MVSTGNSGPKRCSNLQSLTTIARVLCIPALVVVAFSLFAAAPLHASSSLPLGTIFIGDPASCAPGLDWYYYSNGGQTYQNYCQGATISCPNAAAPPSPAIAPIALSAICERTGHSCWT